MNVHAQGGCSVITGPPDITADGTFARPIPTQEECEAAAALVEKFLGTDPRDFRRTVQLADIPGNVRISIGRMGPWDRPRPVGSEEGDLPDKRHIVTWRTPALTVVVYVTEEFAGAVTTLMIADHEGFRICEYPRWPIEGDPRRISIDEIQRSMREGLAGNAQFAACRLELLPLD